MVAMPPMLEVTWSHGALRNSLSCSRSSAEAEYRAMADTTAEIVVATFLFSPSLASRQKGPMQMYCDNMAATFIASNADVSI